MIDFHVKGSRTVSANAVPHPLARPILRPRACPIPVHDYDHCLLPPISDESLKIYENYIKVSILVFFWSQEIVLYLVTL